MPAEWEPHEATWLGWPHNASDWPGKFEIIPWVYGEMIRKISAGENIHLLIRHKKDEQFARRIFKSVGVDLRKIQIRHSSDQSRLDARHRADFRQTASEGEKRKRPSSIFISMAGRNMTTGARTQKFPKPPRALLGKKLFHAECERQTVCHRRRRH